jgi:hypothetical protein
MTSMPDEDQHIRGIDWRRALPFTHLFRAFRVAIHPYKLLLGLLLMLTILLGGKALDRLWPGKYLAVYDEVTLFQTATSPEDFQWERNAALPASYGLFRTFVAYEVTQFTGVAQSVVRNQWFHTETQTGVIGHGYHMLITGPEWLARTHPIFLLAFCMLMLIAWSLFGGAIARLAAVNVARDEKVSIRQALNFSLGKFFSFASAPIIMLLIVVVIGVALSIASLLGNIPFIGPAIVGALFFVALLAAFIQTLLILATVGGFNLMYPTVAVEGTDSFDAISRSFSYVFARPWRMLFYTVVSVGYGAVTFLFVRLFILLMLMLAHHFVELGMFVKNANGFSIFDAMWPSPEQTGRLSFRPNLDQLDFTGRIGARFLAFWLYFVIGLVGAYCISFYFTANTIIYLLIRRELDATEMDEVYLEQTEEDYAPTGGSMDAVAVVAEAETVVGGSGNAGPAPIAAADPAAPRTSTE